MLDFIMKALLLSSLCHLGCDFLAPLGTQTHLISVGPGFPRLTGLSARTDSRSLRVSFNFFEVSLACDNIDLIGRFDIMRLTQKLAKPTDFRRRSRNKLNNTNETHVRK